MGLILVGFGLQDSITAIAKNQFVSLFTYQANAVLNSDVDESEKEALQTDLENYSGIDELLEMYCQNIELQTDKKTVDAVLEVPKELTNFNDFYAFRDRKSGEVYEFPTDGGAAISEKTATMLGVKAGDTVQLKKGDDIVDVKISIIVENYVRHYLYLAPDLYEELFGGAPDYNQLLMKYQDTSSNYETALGEKIMTYDGVAAISFTSDLIDQIDNMLRSLDIVIVVLIVSAGLLALTGACRSRLRPRPASPVQESCGRRCSSAPECGIRAVRRRRSRCPPSPRCAAVGQGGHKRFCARSR